MDEDGTLYQDRNEHDTGTMILEGFNREYRSGGQIYQQPCKACKLRDQQERRAK